MVLFVFLGFFFVFVVVVFFLFGEFCFGFLMCCEIILGVLWKYLKVIDSRCFWKIILKRGLF